MKLTDININNVSVWVKQAQTQAEKGKVIQRIPLLSQANPDWFAVYICLSSGPTLSLGNDDCIFPLMSVIKPFSFLYLLESFNSDKVLNWVGVEPSLMAFNSLEQLIADHGHPRNPMINSGAIIIADKLPGRDGSDRTQLFCEWLNKLADIQLFLDIKMLNSVRANRSPVNLAIAEYLYQAGNIENIDSAIDTYEQICCISGTVADLGKLGQILACESNIINSQNRQLVNSVMLTCGLYEASPQYAVKIGLPMKSGISGALITIVPNQGAIACYSPALDNIGNSVAGLAFIETLSLT
ncbi:glutaminase [Okeanomitos corallinicola TIOX110]|uniref:glutaminase n=1 Tax=Okeanomitos corallinicola TIOX110 TaxID=3133117 RepID=A0ABZ2URL4_9CYAN